MKRHLLFALLVLLAASCRKEIVNDPLPQPSVNDTADLVSLNKNITVVNWNIEWFGSSTFKGDLNVQEANAGKILKYLNADLYGVCEVVDTARFGKMVRTVLGNDFRYAISPYANVAQKLAFVYNRNIFRNVTTRPFLGLSSRAYNSFAAGRFPFLLTADVVVNGQRNPITFILLHAKANADIDSYNKRLNGSLEMKDSLDNYFKQKYFMVLGDYNDNLNGSILTGKASPYQNFLADNNYNAISLPLNAPGYQSTTGFANSVIDQQIISNSMTKWYVSTSASIRTDVNTVVPSYNTNNTSDHYPVSSTYDIK